MDIRFAEPIKIEHYMKSTAIQKDIAYALDPAKFKVTRLDEAMAAIKKHNE